MHNGSLTDSLESEELEDLKDQILGIDQFFKERGMTESISYLSDESRNETIGIGLKRAQLHDDD